MKRIRVLWTLALVVLGIVGFEISALKGKSDWVFGHETIRGRRRYQEDRVLTVVNHTDWAIFGVFDGHGGKHASEFAVDNFYHLFNQRLARGQEHGNALKMAILDVDKLVMEEARLTGMSDGSTACVAMVTPHSVTVANVGDSKALVCKVGGGGTSSTVRLSVDHHPEVAEERRRIEAAGGFVVNKRVNGILAMARAIGDMPLRRYGVISRPDVFEYERDGTSGGAEFLVVASDGIFETMSVEGVCDAISAHSSPLDSADEITRLTSKIVELAFDTGSYDNLSIVIVPL